MGDWEMKQFDLIDDPHLKEWYDNYIEERTSGGESFQDVYRRVAAFLDEVRQRPDYTRVAVFAHGGVLMCAGLYAGLYTADDMFYHLVPYGGILEIKIEN